MKTSVTVSFRTPLLLSDLKRVEAKLRSRGVTEADEISIHVSPSYTEFSARYQEE